MVDNEGLPEGMAVKQTASSRTRAGNRVQAEGAAHVARSGMERKWAWHVQGTGEVGVARREAGEVRAQRERV